ncbi:beta-lactamase/transpeptidase-like protein [Paraphoma chrysanthemicola]|nr:beta-lactamase/transpeptidase-like protein [Paraphoma chrysanthemicola]
MAHKTTEFEQLVLQTMKEWNVPGLSIAVVNGENIDPKAYGHAALSNEECTKDTLFDCASTSKTFTAAAVALLVDDDKYPDVQWTTPVSKLLPDDFVLADAQLTKDVTIEDILSHRTGLATHDESYLSIRAKSPDDAKSMTRNLRHLPLEAPLRTKMIYCNIMYSVASYLVESLTGETYPDFIRKRLWEPLGMTNTFHDLPGIEAADAMDRKATGYRFKKNTNTYTAIPAVYQREGQGAGSVYSSAGDYAKWIRALLQHTVPLSASVQQDLITPRIVDPVEEKYAQPLHSDPLYCLGLYKETYRGHTIITHDGAVPGFKAKMCFLPAHDWGFVMFGNMETAYYVAYTLAYNLIDELLGVPAADRVDWAKFFREQCEIFEEAEREIDPELIKPENVEPLGLPLESVAGQYFDQGYKGIVVECKEGKLVADCTDRCFPFDLTFEHLTGRKFVIESHDVWEDERRKLKGEVRIEDGRVVGLGVGFEKDIEGGLIWFQRTG